MRPADDHAHRLGLGLATLLMAIQLTDKEADERRRERKQSVVHDKWDVLRTAFPDDLNQFQGYGGSGPSVRQLLDTFADVTSSWTPGHRRALLVDVLMSDAFAPYELKVAVDDADEAIRLLAEALALDEVDTARLWEVWNEALTAYRPSRWRRPDHRVKSIPALSTGELVLPPPPGSVGDAIPDDVLGSEHHLALLAGGSLSAVDVTMAGGLWLTDRRGDLTEDTEGDGDGNDRVRRLLALDLAQARTELVKLQMSHALIVAPGHGDVATTASVLEALDDLRDGVVSQLEEQRERNDDDAPQIRILEEIVRAIELAHANVEQVRDAADEQPGAAPAPQPAT
ncbi:MAG TPA: hypothetical protein VK923_17175 [Euzebyales bacterium]|nr:hypothetical protein [Euzebyales bacterium]